MKRRDLIRELEAVGCVLTRHGKRHDIYLNPKTRKQAPVPHSQTAWSVTERLTNAHDPLNIHQRIARAIEARLN